MLCIGGGFQPTIPVENKVRQFMENYYYKPLSLDDIALSVNMNVHPLQILTTQM